MKIIYGGSFNPPTKAHYIISKYLLEKYPDSKLIFLPTSLNYKKKDLISNYQRYKMLKIICKGLGKRAKVSIYELIQKRYKGTFYSLKHFKDSFFVMGADNFKKITTWKHYPDVVKENKFIIIPREGVKIDKIFNENIDLERNKNNFIVENDFENIDISSSEFRYSKDFSLLNKKIAKYIKKHRLYN